MKPATLLIHIILAASLSNLLANRCYANPPALVALSNEHFVIQIDSIPTNILHHVVFRDLGSNIVAQTAVPTQTLARVSAFAGRGFPSMVDAPDAATNTLAFAVDYLCGTITTTGSLAVGSLRMMSSQSSINSEWIQALPIQTNMVSCMTTGPVAWLEYIDRLAQFLELQTGVLTNGDLIFGTAGNWPTNYVPTYTIELNVRYGQ